MKRDAKISECGRYRWSLTRRWGPGRAVCYVGLNPSTADALQDDPTIRRCIGFARRWGFDAVSVVNLFALRTPYPAVLWESSRDGLDIVGRECNAEISRAVEGSDRVVACWGSRKNRIHAARAQNVEAILQRSDFKLYCIRMNLDGYPSHPLYLPYGADLTPFRSSSSCVSKKPPMA